MSDHQVVITFFSHRDVWRVERGTDVVEIPLIDMTDEYYRYRREHPTGDWRAHAEAFCLSRLEESVTRDTKP